jgi:hypothetical protein
VSDEPDTPPEGPSSESLVETVRSVVGEALGDLFSSGKADVAEGVKAPEKAAEKTLTAADVQRLARDEMSRAQEELRAKRAKKAPAAQPAAPEKPPPAPAVRGFWEKIQHGIWGEKD